jgi:hypothetical protein
MVSIYGYIGCLAPGISEEVPVSVRLYRYIIPISCILKVRLYGYLSPIPPRGEAFWPYW